MEYNDIEHAYEDYLMEKEEIINKLCAIRDTHISYNTRNKWINEIIKFVESSNL